MSAKHLMDGLTTYTDPEELAATAAAEQPQSLLVSITYSILVSVLVSYKETAL